MNRHLFAAELMMERVVQSHLESLFLGHEPNEGHENLYSHMQEHLPEEAFFILHCEYLFREVEVNGWDSETVLKFKEWFPDQYEAVYDAYKTLEALDISPDDRAEIEFLNQVLSPFCESA